MTKDVLVSIKGLHFADSDVRDGASDEELDSIETICPGEYYFRNNAHFVVYEEMTDDYKEPVKSIIKLKAKEFTITKKGPVNVQMVFSEGKKTLTDYHTPFGNIMVAIDTRSIAVEENENALNITIVYGLEANYQFLSECTITIHINGKNML